MNPADTADTLPTDYWNAERMGQVFSYMRWFIKLNMPWIMLGVAFFVAIGILGVILGIFAQVVESKRRHPHEDDEEFDVYYN